MDKHPHAAALDRLGRERVRTHFNITTRAIQKWRAGGVPKMHWKTLQMLADINGVQVPELAEKVA